MALHLYRRHRTDCDAGRPNEFRSSEVEERRKGWGRKCRCLIQISGTLASRLVGAHSFRNKPVGIESDVGLDLLAEVLVGAFTPGPHDSSRLLWTENASDRRRETPPFLGFGNQLLATGLVNS